MLNLFQHPTRKVGGLQGGKHFGDSYGEVLKQVQNDVAVGNTYSSNKVKFKNKDFSLFLNTPLPSR
jgi:hypothetical protein